MPKWMKRQMSLGMSPVIPAGLGLRSDEGHPSGGAPAPAGQNNEGADSGDGDQGDSGDDGDQGKGPKIDGDFDADRASRAIAAARDAEKKAKADSKAKDDRIAAILKAAGITPDGKEDPAEQLKTAAAERDQAKATAKQQAIELAVYKSAGKAGGDADALLDSRSFLGQLSDLDPTAKNFGDKVADAIKAAVQANPKLATQQQSPPPGKSGAPIPGGSAGKNTTNPTLNSAVAARYSK